MANPRHTIAGFAPSTVRTIAGTMRTDVAVTERELGYLLVRIALDRCGRPDADDFDLYVGPDGETRAGGDHEGFEISRDPSVAALVLASHALHGRNPDEYRLTGYDIMHPDELAKLQAESDAEAQQAAEDAARGLAGMTSPEFAAMFSGKGGAS
jgi:hypothetical protein